MPAGLSAAERERYARQLILPGWGEAAQERLRRATVFVAGAGGLGSAAILYLAAAGVGRLRICDSGRVEPSNLNRQVVHGELDVGAPKAVSAAAAVRDLNAHVSVDALEAEITLEKVGSLVADADLIVDCLDNVPARLLLNAFAVRARRPMIHAGVNGLGGQLTFIDPPATPCLACVFGEAAGEPPPEPGPVPILGAVAGTVGCLEALEALRYLAGFAPATRGRILFWDGAAMEWQAAAVAKDPACPVCGASPAAPY